MLLANSSISKIFQPPCGFGVVQLDTLNEFILAELRLVPFFAPKGLRISVRPT